MRDFPDHPVIASIERTGYPPWIKDDLDEYDPNDIYEDEPSEDDDDYE